MSPSPSSSPSPEQPSASPLKEIKIRDPQSGEWESLDGFAVSRKEPLDHDQLPKSHVGIKLQQLKELREGIEPEVKPDERAQAISEMIELFAEENVIIRRAVLRSLYTARESALSHLRESLHSSDPNVATGSAIALGALYSKEEGALRKTASLTLAEALPTLSPVVEQSALTGLRYLGDNLAKEALLKHLKSLPMERSSHVVRTLAQCADPSLLEPILDYLQRDGGEIDARSLSAQLAALITPTTLADLLPSDLGIALGERFGFLDKGVATFLRINRPEQGDATSEAFTTVDELLRGVGVVSTPLFNTYRGLDPEKQRELLFRWGKRVSDLQWSLFPDELLTQRKIARVPIDDSTPSKIDQTLLFAALREADRSNIEIKGEVKPFHRKHAEQLAGSFFYCSLDGFLSKRLPAWVARAEELLQSSGASYELSETVIPYLIPRFAAVESETRGEESAEMGFQLSSTIKTLPRMIEVKDDKLTPHPHVAQKTAEYYGDAIEEIPTSDQYLIGGIVEHLMGMGSDMLSKLVVLDREVLSRQIEIMRDVSKRGSQDSPSAGVMVGAALFAQGVAASIGEVDQAACDTVHGFLLDLMLEEQIAAKAGYPSLGVELQSTSISCDELFCWKHALGHFGINSPRRPEFFSMLEAAFPPSHASSSFRTSIPILLELGFSPSNVVAPAVHLSFSGDLGEEAKYLALPLRTMTGTPAVRDESWKQSMARVMSKGLVYKNPDSVPVHDGGLAPACHTEIRTARLIADAASHQSLPLSELIDHTHQLAFAASSYRLLESGAALSPAQEEAGEVWIEYRKALNDLYSSPSLGAAELLAADWYESSGDPRDLKIVDDLKLVDLLAHHDRKCIDGSVFLSLRRSVARLMDKTSQKIKML